jgi:hypothetical protein
MSAFNYYAKVILINSPFTTIDIDGDGIAVTRGRDKRRLLTPNANTQKYPEMVPTTKVFIK